LIEEKVAIDMSQNEENWLVNLLVEISNKIYNNFFNYIDNFKYNELIARTVSEIKEKIIAVNNEEEIEENYFGYNNQKALILDSFNNMFKNRRDYSNLDPNSKDDKELIENVLNQISVQLTHYDYDVFTDNDYSNIINNHNHYTYVQKKPYRDYEKHLKENLDILIVHNNIYNQILTRGLDVWRDYKNSSLYYRIKPFEDKQKIDKIKLSNYLSKLFNKNIEIYDNTENIEYLQSEYLIISLLPIVKMEIFNPYSHIEFPHIINEMYYKNRFQYTNFLKKRYIQSLRPIIQHESTIVDFIKYLSQDEYQYKYIMNWLSSFFQNLHSSKIALVLIGDVDTTNTLIYDVMKPIFANKNEYISVINDETLKKTNDLIINDKIFYHIDEISALNIKNKRTSKLVLEILSKKYGSAQDAWENNESFINGELIVTSSKNSPYPFLKDSYSRCTVLKVKYLDTILKNLNVDRLSLKEEIQNDLNNFSSILSNYDLDKSYHNVIDTEEKKALPKMKNGIIKTTILNNQVKQFINAIFSCSLKLFDNLKREGDEFYQEFKYNYEEKMIAQPLLSRYFNLMFDEITFPDNSHFIEILKEQAEMFKQSPNDKTKYNGKKRYKIF